MLGSLDGMGEGKAFKKSKKQVGEIKELEKVI